MAVILELKVFPSAGRHEWLLDKSGMIKVYLKAQPERGKANKELLQSLAKQLGLSTNQVLLLSGDTSQKKRIKIESTLSRDEIYQKLGLGLQSSIME